MRLCGEAKGEASKFAVIWIPNKTGGFYGFFNNGIQKFICKGPVYGTLVTDRNFDAGNCLFEFKGKIVCVVLIKRVYF